MSLQERVKKLEEGLVETHKLLLDQININTNLIGDIIDRQQNIITELSRVIRMVTDFVKELKE